MRMLLKDGKMKVLTLSYDDGVVQDARLVEIMSKYGLKGTFNINSGMEFAEEYIRRIFRKTLSTEDAKSLYLNSGNEVAIHSLTHPHLEVLSEEEIIYEITEDRRNIEKDYGVIAKGMAYPFGTYNETVVEILKRCGIVYSRTVNSTYGFEFPENWLLLNPTCHHNCEKLIELVEKFVETKYSFPKMFYLWGHSYEFDENDNWEVIEKFAEFVGNRDDIWYATNMEIYEYVKAYNNLVVSIDRKIVHNSSSVDVWFLHQDKKYCARCGETIYL
ncbi:MAG: polysaccharide deacetylase family protein [Clostridia bacterium]|nr:polysaccharide deacetylase family protein [Clostridia bacterium]